MGPRILKSKRVLFDLTQEEIYAQLIKYTKNLGYPRTVQGNGLVYLKERK